MATKIRQKEYIDKNVYDKTLERIRYVYDTFDKVVVSFSGGKDSTVVLNCALKIAKEKNKLPLEVVFFDEEAIHPPTIEYVERVRNQKDINLLWYCLEWKHRNACSNEEPFWYCWEKGKEDIWVRELPANVITSNHKFKKGMAMQDFSLIMYDNSYGKVALLTGIRTQESLRRYQTIAKKKNDSYIQSRSEKNNIYNVHPIYDWSSEDVWLAVHKFDWDYNKTYDIFNQTSMFEDYLHQRVCPPFGEEPLRGLWVYAECFPEMWHKMIARCQGVATAWRYGNTELYSSAKSKPSHLTWREYLNVILDSYDGKTKNDVVKQINMYIRMHFNKTKMELEDELAHPLSGVSWKWLCTIAIRGDFKGRQKSAMLSNGETRLKQLGITLEDARKIYK